MISYLPKTFSDLSALIFLIIATIGTYVFELNIVVPYIHNIDHAIIYFHIIIGTIIIFNLLSNVVMLITTDTSTMQLMLPSTLKPDWRFCVTCESNSPPRSYHCATCNKCILKRDHHCVFTGCCIGYKNFRYYYSLLIYLSIGGLYSSVLNTFFIWDQLGGFGITAIFCYLFPIPFWLFGKIPFKVTLWTLVSLLDFLGFMFSTVLLYYHGLLLINNQTTYEKNKNMNTYNLGDWKSNVIESLGPNWLACVLVSPFVKSTLSRNGIDFPTRRDYYNPTKSKYF